MSTASQLITRASNQLLSGTIEERNKITNILSTSETSVIFQYDLGGIRSGAVIEVDSELMYVWDAASGTKTVTVERGYNGTTAATHAVGAVAKINPRFPRSLMFEALKQDILDLSSPVNGLYAVVVRSIEYNGSDRMIELPAMPQTVFEVMDIRLEYLTTDQPLLHKVRMERNVQMVTANGPRDVLVFDESVMAGTIWYTTKEEFAPLTVESAELSTLSIPASLEDILEMGTMIRCMSSREIKRNFIESQGDTRRSDEVPAGSVSNSANNLIRLRRDRIIAEAARLGRQYPLKIRK